MCVMRENYECTVNDMKVYLKYVCMYTVYYVLKLKYIFCNGMFYRWFPAQDSNLDLIGFKFLVALIWFGSFGDDSQAIIAGVRAPSNWSYSEETRLEPSTYRKLAEKFPNL